MTAAFQTVPLTGFSLPADAGLLRDHVRPEDRQTPHYLERYDRSTLFYDLVYLPRARGHLFTAPRFLNLWKPFRDGLRRNGQPVKIVARRTWLRCEQVFIPGTEAPLTLDLEGYRYELPVRPDMSAMFDGHDTLLAVSKNNRLDWIADWARFHAEDHGTSGVVIFDNGSTDYAPADVTETLAGVRGIERALVYSAPYPYGPADRSGRLDVSPRFFQSAMLNIARRDALSQARAVLSIDIDELVTGGERSSIYDLAMRHPFGMVTIRGNWAYPDPGADGPQNHAAHLYSAVPDRPCNPKWCMVPQGVFSRVFGWAVHKIGGVLQPLLTRQSRHRLVHCRACSTGWKPNRFGKPERTERNRDLMALMARHFDRDLGVSRRG